MRQLQDWLGQTVRVQGVLDRWTAEDHRLLINVHLKNYWTNEERVIDHIWLADGSKMEKKRLTSYWSLATVIRYWRSNGTCDYGICTKPSLDVSAEMEAIFKAGVRGRTKAWVIESLETIIAAIYAESAVIEAWDETPAQVKEFAQMMLDRCKTDYALNLQRSFESHLRQHRYASTSNKDFIKGRKLPQPMGFAQPKKSVCQ